MWTSRVPLPQDDANCSHDVTIDQYRIGADITISGSPTITFGNDFSSYGSWVESVAPTTAGKVHRIRGRSTGYVSLFRHSITVMSSCSYTTMEFNRSGGSLAITNTTGITITVTNFLCPVSTTNTLTITGGTITKAGGGQIALDYLVLDTSTVTPAATWYAGEHSYISGGTVSGWIFGDPSGGGSKNLMPAIII
jgi:hypothetical protein